MPVNLEPLLMHLPAWTLVLFRLGGIFMVGPVYGSNVVPARVKIFFAIGLSLCVYPILLSPGSQSAANMQAFIRDGLSLWTLAGAVLHEITIGLIIGFGVTIPLAAMQLAGRMVDQQMGLGVAAVFNPELDSEAGIISEFFFLFALALYIILGGHRVALAVLVGTFHNIPLGGFAADGSVVELAVGLMNSMFDLSLRVAAPLLVLIFLETVAMGFIARTVPQMNILSIGFAVRIMIGGAMLIGMTSILDTLYEDSLLETMEQLRLYFAEWSPGTL